MAMLEQCPECKSGLLQHSTEGKTVCTQCGWTHQPKYTNESRSQSRPWLRWAARWIDTCIFALVIALMPGFILGLADAPPETLDTFYDSPGADQAFGILFMVVYYTFLEPMMLSAWGTTPGKALLNIKVLQRNGEKLSYSQALTRSLSVWLKGMGLGIPLISLITLVRSYNFLRREGITEWDRDGDFSVSHQAIGSLKGMVIVLLLLTVLGCLVLINL